MKCSVNLVTATINENTKEDILNALTSISMFDGDFVGRNGPQYLCSSAKQSGFESNQEFLLDMVSKLDDIKQIVHKFMKYWLGYDGYYESYKYDIIYDKNNIPTAISLAYTHRC